MVASGETVLRPNLCDWIENVTDLIESERVIAP
jgi:hypothetical protein